MESLLSPAFDRISSRDTKRIAKGLRQIEGLLAQICLSQPQLQTPSKRKLSSDSSGQRSVNGSLSGLNGDPVFIEFYRLQESFQWNVPSRLIECLERLLGLKSSVETDRLIAKNLSVLQGTMLLHPPSRTLFGREVYMNMVLDLLDPTNDSQIMLNALVVLVVALLDCPRSARTLESADGLQTVTSLFRSNSTSQLVKMRVLDFLNFYLMPEEPPSRPSTSKSDPSEMTTIHSSPGKQSAGTVKTVLSSSSEDDSTIRRSTSEKRRMLGEYMYNVDQLANDLSRIAPFVVPGL